MKAMKKIAAIMCAMLCVGLLTGCGQSYETTDSTVFVLKDGKIISTDVEKFDVNTYDETGLRTYIEQALSAYTAVHGEDAIVLKELKLEDGTATLMLEYASAADYTAFNGIELYTGSVSSALSEGYSFDAEFAAVSGGTSTLCKVSDFIAEGYQVAIIRSNVNINVPGKVLYVSTENTTWVDDRTIAIRENTNLLGKAPEVQEQEHSTETKTENDTETESTQDDEEDEDDMPATDEDILDVTEEEPEIVFEFTDEAMPGEEVDDEASEFSNVYTYIIYKK